MSSKKVWNAWAVISVVLILMSALPNWMNHPQVVSLIQHQNLWLFLSLFIGVGLLRRIFLKLPFRLAEGFFTAVLISFLTPKCFDRVPSSLSHLKIVWFTALALSLYALILLGWETAQDALKKIPALKKVNIGILLMLFTGASLAVCLMGLPPTYFPLVLFLGFTPLVRYYFMNRDPEITKAFALFFLTDWLYRSFPEVSGYTDWAWLHNFQGLWNTAFLLHHFLLSALVFLFWEKLKEPKAQRGRIYLSLFAILPMLPFHYFGFGNWAWPVQILVLGLLWGWNPWLKPHAKEVFLSLWSLAALLMIQANTGSWLIPMGLLVLTFATAQVRTQYFKLPQALLRALAFYGVGGWATTLYSSGDNPWILAGHLILSGLFLVFWERMREEKHRNLRAWIWIYALLPIPFMLFKKNLIWALQVLVLYLTRFYQSLGAAGKLGKDGLPEVDWETKWNAIQKSPLYQKTARFLKQKGKQGGEGIVEISKNPAARKGALGLLALAAAWAIFTLVYDFSTTHIISFTPQGIITTPNTVIRAKFSDDVQAVGSLDSAFEIVPTLPGTTRLEDSNTLVFTPSAPLKPASAYQVKLDVSGKLKSNKWFVQGSSKTAFATEPLKVVSSRLFYTYDLIKETEKELVGEIEFNYPVEMNVLKQNLSVARAGSPLNYELEQGTLPTRFFFKAGGLERETEPQVLTLTVDPALTCVDGGKPLGDKYQNTVTLPAKPKMLVNEIKLHHVPGNTLISILFSLPASADQVRNNVTIEPALAFKVDTEYCYAVLKADFQPNIDYKIHVKEGLRAESGEALEHPSEQIIRLEDIQPSVRFGDSGRLIPLEGGKIVAVKTMNLDNYWVYVNKIFRNNIVQYLKNNYDAGLGANVWNGKVDVKGGQINQETETDLDFSKWHAQAYKGIFNVTLNGSNGGGRDSRVFLCTDLGLMLKHSGDDLLVQVLSISKLTPGAGVKLQLISENNQVIQEKETDLEGRAWFTDWKNNPYNFRPFVIVAELGDDWSYLRLDQEALNQSRFDVGGDPFQSSGWDAFLSSDRGLYRPGETANFTAVVRHADLEIPADLPVNVTIRDGSGSQVAKLTAKLQDFGMATFTFPIPEDITTGMLNVELGLENGVHLANTTIKVEEFIPNKIKVEVRPAKKTTAPGEQLAFEVAVRQLFGAPGANLKVHTAVQLSALEYTNKNWKGYQFSDPTRQFNGEDLKVPSGTTDSAGNFDVQLPVPISMLPPSMLQAEVYAEVLDTGGRPVGANAAINVHRYPYYLGLKCEEGKEVAPNKKVHIKYVAITPDGEPTKVEKADLIVKRKIWYSIFRRSGWSGEGYDSDYYEQVVDGKEIDVDGKGAYTFTPDKPGEYTIYLGNEESMRSSIRIAVSGPEEKQANAGESTDLGEPDKLSLNLDKTQYQVGEIPSLEVRAPFAGRLMLSIEREKVFYTSTVPVAAGLNVVPLPAVATAYLPNAYVVGLLVRKPDESLRNLPMASFGIIPLGIDTSSHEIDLKWKAPESVKSQEGIDVNLSTGAPGAKVVLAAVDEGILQIIAFTTPDPFKYFYRKRGLTTSTLSLFEDILPDLDRKDAVGGDEGESFQFRHLNPIEAKRVKSFALFSGILTADKEGNLSYHFPTDKFHGEVRVMALGVEENKFGASAFHVKVADPVVVEPSFPRFMAPGDHIDVPVLVYNNTKKAQTIKIALSSDGPVAVDGEKEQVLKLGEEGQQQILFHAKANMDAGVAHFKVTATDDENNSFDVDTELAVRPGNPLTTQISFGQLSGGGSQALSVPGGFIKQGQKVRLTVSSSPLLTFLGSMDYLIHYPYGCAEQRTSQAFPLLYFKDMGLLTGRFEGRANAVEMYVQAAVDDLSKMQLSDGSFALWPGEQENGGDYLSHYVSEFLLTAQKMGYQVNPDVMNRILNRLGAIKVTGQGVGRLDRRQQNVEIEDSAYVLYLKVLAGRTDAESMAAMRDQMKDPKARSLSDRCYLSRAYSAMGDRSTALAILPVHYLPTNLARELDGDWFSPNREMALYLLALTDADPQNAEIPKLIIEFGKTLQQSGRGWFGTTQEDALCFMAIGKAVQATTLAYPLSAQWSVKGGTPNALAGETAVVKDEELSGKDVSLNNTGSRNLYYHLMAEGTKLKSEKESVSNGLFVSREYRDETGSTINLGSISQGQLVVVTLRVKCSRPLDNLVVVDLLPAGFEVDNPRLSSRGNLSFEPDCTFQPAFQDFRDDRVLLFSRNVEGDQTFSYSVRAVTPGSFQVPGLEAEAMYDPQIYGRSNEGQTLVIAPAKY